MENVLLSAGVSFVAAIIASYIGSRAALKSTKMNVEVSTRTMLLNNAVKCAEIEYGAVVKASMESKTDLKPSPFMSIMGITQPKRNSFKRYFNMRPSFQMICLIKLNRIDHCHNEKAEPLLMRFRLLMFQWC